MVENYVSKLIAASAAEGLSAGSDSGSVIRAAESARKASSKEPTDEPLGAKPMALAPFDRIESGVIEMVDAIFGADSKSKAGSQLATDTEDEEVAPTAKQLLGME